MKDYLFIDKVIHSDKKSDGHFLSYVQNEDLIPDLSSVQKVSYTCGVCRVSHLILNCVILELALKAELNKMI